MLMLPLFIRNLRYRLFFATFKKQGFPLTELGNPATGCAWKFYPAQLSSESIIYSGGVGRDITFEHALVQEFGCSVVLFDPSPTGVETMAKVENQIPKFKFCRAALSAKCGILKFAPPACKTEGSWSMQRKYDAQLEVPAWDLGTAMKNNDHAHIDLLKIDIEGSEYEVIDDIVARKLAISQILVEFHHGNADLPGIERKHTIRAILKLRAAGYWLLDQSGSNYVFLRSDLGLSKR